MRWILVMTSGLVACGANPEAELEAQLDKPVVPPAIEEPVEEPVEEVVSPLVDSWDLVVLEATQRLLGQAETFAAADETGELRIDDDFGLSIDFEFTVDNLLFEMTFDGAAIEDGVEQALFEIEGDVLGTDVFGNENPLQLAGLMECGVGDNGPDVLVCVADLSGIVEPPDDEEGAEPVAIELDLGIALHRR